jgi:hypothetical protein
MGLASGGGDTEGEGRIHQVCLLACMLAVHVHCMRNVKLYK